MRILFVVFYDPQDLGSRHLAAYMQNKGHEVAIMAIKASPFSAGNSLRMAKARPSPEEVSGAFVVMNGATDLKQLFTGEAESVTPREWELLGEAIAAWKPDLLGYGTRSMNHPLLPDAIAAMRKGAPQAFLVAGGAGPTLEPELSLNLGVDAVIRGEGEYALEELAHALEQGKDWRGGHNLVYMEEGEFKYTPMLPLQKDLDAFPLPLSDPEKMYMIEQDRITQAGAVFKDRVGMILSSRGCPLDCSFCLGRELRKVYKDESHSAPRLRRHSLERILAQALRAKNEGYRQILFCDEYFIHPVDKLIDFFIKYRERVALPFFALLSTKQLASNPALLDAAHNADWTQFCFGLQSGSRDFCLRVYNRHSDHEQLLAVTHACVSKGMSGSFYMIAGNPMETDEELQESYDLLARLPAFDPSFKTSFAISSRKLMLTPQLLKQFPQLKNMHCSHEDFYRQGMLLQLRTVLDDEEFAAVQSDKRYKESPHLLGSLYHDSLREKHARYLAALLPTLEGRECYFWGCGGAYQQNKALFSHTRPKAVLYDLPSKAPDSVDGIPVLHPDKAFAEAPDIPVVVFSGHLRCNAIHRKLLQRYNREDDVVFCAHIP